MIATYFTMPFSPFCCICSDLYARMLNSVCSVCLQVLPGQRCASQRLATGVHCGKNLTHDAMCIMAQCGLLAVQAESGLTAGWSFMHCRAMDGRCAIVRAQGCAWCAQGLTSLDLSCNDQGQDWDDDSVLTSLRHLPRLQRLSLAFSGVSSGCPPPSPRCQAQLYQLATSTRSPDVALPPITCKHYGCNF